MEMQNNKEIQSRNEMIEVYKGLIINTQCSLQYARSEFQKEFMKQVIDDMIIKVDNIKQEIKTIKGVRV